MQMLNTFTGCMHSVSDAHIINLSVYDVAARHGVTRLCWSE